MTTAGIKRDLKRAGEAVEKERSQATGKYGRGLAREGYAGGYRDALRDVDMALRGTRNSYSRYWPKN